MKLYRLEMKQFLSIQLEKAWDFFSRPENLEEITPPWLHFKIASPLPEKMYAGLIIEYRIQALLGIPMTWITEITHMNAPFFFVDEQRFGPYKFWHHQHWLQPVKGGVEMQDIVHYRMPFGPVGHLSHIFFVKRQLHQIFSYRFACLEDRFRATL